MAEPPPQAGLRRALPRLRTRLLQLSVLPVLAVGLATALGAGVSLQRQAERETEAVLQLASREALANLSDIASRLAGYAIVTAQRRDLQDAVAARDGAQLRNELTVLYWDLRSNDPLLRTVALVTPDGTLLAHGGQFNQSAPPTPESAALVRQAADGGRIIGLIPHREEGIMLGAAVPVTAAATGEVLGVLKVLARLDGALARELSARVRGHVLLLLGGRVVGTTIRLDGAVLPDWLARAATQGGAGAGALEAAGAAFDSMAAPLADVTGKVQGHVAVVRPQAGLRGSLTQASLALLATAIVLLFVTLPLVWSAARRLARPLEALAGTLRRLEGGETEAAIPALPAGSPGEIVALADALARLRATLREREELSGKLSWMANFDPVTRIPNRNLFTDRLTRALAAARRSGRPVALMLIDLDRFKAVNDTMGHAAGDAVLRAVGERLAAVTRASDTVARLGGDEFALIQADVARPEDSAALAERLILALSAPIPIGHETAEIGASVGISFSTGARDDEPEAVQREADLALYRAKEDGRGCYRIFDSTMDLQARERRALVNDLRGALAQGQLRLVFQPQFSLPDRRLCGAEALLRWHHPERGNVPPDVFIGLAEQSGLIQPIGDWVLHEAARAASAWPDCAIAVNVSPLQLRQPEFLATLRAAVEGCGLRPGQLEIEVTEGVMVVDTEATIRLFDAIRAMGVRVALDDFGTGFSSLAQLQRFSFDKIKLDRAFVHPLGRSQTAMTLLRAVVGMTRALGVRLNAEGVELDAQMEVLTAEGCSEVQGYLLGRPMEYADFAGLVSRSGLPPGPGRLAA